MITPMDIHNKTFSKGLRGYSEEEVNDFLRQIVTDYEQIYREHREMEEEMDQMKVKLSNYERISDTMTATLQLAKDTAENVKKNAKRNADILISNAKMEGDRQVKDAEDYRRRLAETMIHTEGNMKNYVSKIRKDLELALASINALENLKAPIVPGYAYPAVELPEEEAPADAPAEEIPTEEVPDKAAPAEETPVEEPVEETVAPTEEPAPDAEGTPTEELAPAAEEADMAEEKPEEEKEAK
ncbi:MAG: DivIVA domain-containing protein [Dialister sp.]|nr:DivIVA domain-containing protein [Dialister sp.]